MRKYRKRREEALVELIFLPITLPLFFIKLIYKILKFLFVSPEKRAGGFDNSRYLKKARSFEYHKKPLLNKSEFKVFAIIEKHIKSKYPNYRVMAQVNMGEIIRTEASNYAQSGINSKRIDIMIINGAGYPCVAVEYQGSGHYQGDARIRDEIKKIACEKAGINFIEIFPNAQKKAITSYLDEILV